MFAIAAAVIAVLALFGIGTQTMMLWLWLGFIALHFAFGPVIALPLRRTDSQ